MTADCTTYDDLCHLQREYAAEMRAIQTDQDIEGKTVLLGIFNGRVYTYSEIDGRTVISIMNAKPDKLGKFELPDAIPPDFLEVEGTVDTGDKDHGKGR